MWYGHSSGDDEPDRCAEFSGNRAIGVSYSPLTIAAGATHDVRYRPIDRGALLRAPCRGCPMGAPPCARKKLTAAWFVSPWAAPLSQGKRRGTGGAFSPLDRRFAHPARSIRARNSAAGIVRKCVALRLAHIAAPGWDSTRHWIAMCGTRTALAESRTLIQSVT